MNGILLKKKATALAVLGMILLLLVACATKKPAGESTGENTNPTESAKQTEAEGSETEEETVPETEPEPQVPVKRVIFLAGQSNAVGNTYSKFLPDRAGKISAERVKEMKAGYENIKIMYCTNPFNPSTRVKDESEDFVPVTFGFGVKDQKPIDTTFGPEVGMAEYLNKNCPGEEFYIIKCASGASNLFRNWNPTDRSENNLYRQMIEFSDKALSKLTEDGSRAEIIAFCWMQGEADASSVPAATYNRLFSQLINAFKEKYKDILSSDGMAVIQAGISDHWKNYQQLNAGKEQWTKENENAYYFSTNDLTYNLDNTDYAHYDAAGQVILGNRFAENVLAHLNKAGG